MSSSSSSAAAQEEAVYGSPTPKDIKGKTSILRLLNSEENDETAAAAESLLLLQQQSGPAKLAQEAHDDDAEVVAAARILLALATEDGAEVTDNEGEVFPVDEGAFASASNAPINLPGTTTTTTSTSTGPAEVLDHQRVVDLCRQGHYATGRPFRLMNPEAPKGVMKIYHPVPMSEVHRLNIPTKDFVYLNHKKGNGENVAAAAAAKPAAVPATSSFTAINGPPAADAQRPEAKPKVAKPAAKQPAGKPATKPAKKRAAKKEASAPVAPTPQEKPEVVKKTSSGRAVKKPKLYES